MSIETKRDIFRKEMLYVKKNQKLEKMKAEQNNGLQLADVIGGGGGGGWESWKMPPEE